MLIRVSLKLLSRFVANFHTHIVVIYKVEKMLVLVFSLLSLVGSDCLRHIICPMFGNLG